MRKLIWILFPPFEVKATIKEIDAFLENTAMLCKDIIRRDVISLARDVNKTIYSIQIRGMKPDQLALLLITNVLGKHISSGRYHIYRGMLNMVGSDMLKVWSAAVTALRARGYYSDSEVEEDMSWIKKQIENAG